MSIATGLIAKLLLAVSVIPAAGYGGYCAYDHYNPTFHNQLIQQGFLFSPISGDMGSSEDFNQRRDEIAKNIGGDWRCSKQLFWDLEAPKPNITTNQDTGNGTLPSSSVSSESDSEADYEGCLAADLGHVTDNNKKAGFIKWELALRSGNKGFIYVGYFSIGKSKSLTTTGTDYSDLQESFSTVFEVAKEENEWKIKHGLNWADYFTTKGSSINASTVNNFGTAEIKISLPNNYEWSSNGTICNLVDGTEGEKCPSKEQWTFKRYVGFWEKGEEGKQAIDAIKIEALEKKDGSVTTTHKHDIWSNQNFDFSKSAQDFGGKPVWGGSLSHVYDVGTNKWKNAPTSPNDATEYLKAIYKPWAKKKGTWMEAKEVCYESNSRSLGEESAEAKRLLKFCYQNKK